MRVYDIICEAVPQPVRNLKIYAQNRLKEVTRLEQIAARLLELEKQLGSRPSNNIYYHLKQIGVDPDMASEALSEVETLARRAGSEYGSFSLDTARTNLQWILDLLNDPDRNAPTIDYIYKAVGYLASHLAQDTNTNFDYLINLGSHINEIVKGMTEEGYLDPKYADPEEIQEYQAWFEAIKLAAQFAAIWQRLVASKRKLDDLISMRQTLTFGQKPKTDEVETLYHASAWADELGKEGFQMDIPDVEKRKGLGSYGAGEGLVSFTHDIHAARNIARSMKELVMIANGQMRKHHILRWLSDEGVDIQRLNSTSGFDVRKAPDTPKITAKLFHVWLFINKIGRENPLFTNIEETVDVMRGRDVNDVGIIAAKVNMQDPEIEYVPAEKEWRVPPRSILKSKRIQ